MKAIISKTAVTIIIGVIVIAVIAIAIWRLWPKHSVTFDLDGGIHTGGGELYQEVSPFLWADEPTTEKPGYTFAGWTESFDFVRSDRNPKAIWIKNDEDVPPPVSTPPVSTPPVSTPPVSTPPVSTPPNSVDVSIVSAWIDETYDEGKTPYNSGGLGYWEMGPPGSHYHPDVDPSIGMLYFGLSPEHAQEEGFAKEQAGYEMGYKTDGNKLFIYSNPLMTDSPTMDCTYRLADGKLYVTYLGGEMDHAYEVGHEYTMLPYGKFGGGGTGGNGTGGTGGNGGGGTGGNGGGGTGGNGGGGGENGGGEDSSTSSPSSSSTSLTPSTGKTTYSITFDPNGGTRTGGGELVQAVEEGAAPAIPVVARSGYDFVRWSPAVTAAAGDAVYIAEWRTGVSPAFKVTFDPAGGTNLGTVLLTQYVYPNRSAVEPSFGRLGFVFAGWKTEWESGEPPVMPDGKKYEGAPSFKKVIAPLKVTAIWESIPPRLPTVPPMLLTSRSDVRLDKASYAPGENISVTTSGITATMAQDKAFVAIFNAGAQHGDWQEYHYPAEGGDTLLFTAPSEIGDYEMRLYRRDGEYTDETFVMSVPFTVTGPADTDSGEAEEEGSLTPAIMAGIWAGEMTDEYGAINVEFGFDEDMRYYTIAYIPNSEMLYYEQGTYSIEGSDVFLTGIEHSFSDGEAVETPVSYQCTVTASELMMMIDLPWETIVLTEEPPSGLVTFE